MDEWIAIRRVSKGFKRFVDSQVAVDLVIEWQMKKDSIGIEPENMTFGIYADLSIGGNHVLERYDEIDKLIWLWPTVLIRSISVHCFYLTNHATNGDFRMHHYLLQELANFLELVSSKSLKNLKKLEFATQDSFSSFFVCPDYTIPQFKRILARLPSNMDSIEFQTFPNNDGLIGHLLGLKPKSLLILGNDELLEDSLDLMKHNYDTTLYMYLTSIEDHEGLLESYDNLCEIWRTSMKKHSNAIHVQFTETNRVTEFLENKVKASEERRCVHFPTAIFKLDYKITKRYGTHTEAGLSLTVEERSERKTSLRKIKKETKDLYLLPRKFSLMDGISLNDLPDYESCVRADSPPYSPSCDTYPHEGFQMEDVDLEAKCLDRFMEFDDYERLILNAIQAV
ncbi:hypothetical protein L596_013405 [Steinernema carpocapsae]|nr:hypothetical protein L596_013405 [Steinernema carpocapsae]